MYILQYANASQHLSEIELNCKGRSAAIIDFPKWIVQKHCVRNRKNAAFTGTSEILIQ